jgi:hypothetical protein
MNTDTEIRTIGIKALATALGDVQAERFIALILREPFDYTEWQKSLWTDSGLVEISKKAIAFRRAHGAKFRSAIRT